MFSAISRRSLLRISSALAFAGVVAASHGVARVVQAVEDGPNPIVVENDLPGTTDNWEVFDPADPGARGVGDPTIQGFATDISVNKGSTVSFKIKLAAASPVSYEVDIYRLGYYRGAGARKVGQIVPSAADVTAARSQPACDVDANALADCGNWTVTGTFSTSGLTSGIYIARPKRTDTLGASHIVFIVRDDLRAADVIMQTSDTTWQAYNQYPNGASTYCNGPLSNASGDYACANRAPKVSYNRPFDTRAHDATSWLFNAEYPMVRWLEANGYDVKYWSGVDTDRLGADPAIGLTSANRPQAFLSVGHDEYWSGQQRANVESARNGGVNLAFFSGNEMFWKTRYESSTVSTDGSPTAFRTLVTYKETFESDPVRLDPNPNNPWTGTWRDPRFSPVVDGERRPENALTGQLWTVNCCSDALTIPDTMKNLRIWRNTAVTQLGPGQVYRASPGTVGYEWDEDVDNGFRPAGLVRMSSLTTTVPQKVLDYGTNVGFGTATHSITMYRHNSGALVFGAGTVQWSWGLDGAHDRDLVVPDQVMQQATVNLLADMGAHPETPQMGAGGTPLQLASTSNDIFAPTSTISSPGAGASVASGTPITISGTATESGGGTVAAVEVSVDGQTWHQAAVNASGNWTYQWQPGAVGAATIRSRATDDSGNMESAGVGVGVTIVTGDCPCTSLWKSTAVPAVPMAADSSAVEVGLKFYSDIDGFITGVRFYKGSGNTGTHVGNLWTTGGVRLATATFAGETGSGWQQVLFAEPVQINAGTTYVVSYHTNVGNYSADGAYFGTTGIDSPPLHAAASAVTGGNGVYKYGPDSTYPTETFNATNYWVDVVFSPTLADSSVPAISLIKASIIDSSRVTVTWSTDEPATSKIQYSTDPAILIGPTNLPPGTVTVNQSAFVTAHSMTLSGLTPNTTYYYRVISTDRSGNSANVPAPTFTVPGPTLRDTSATDFGAGIGNGTYVSATADGELILSPTAGSEFSGTALQAGWISTPWGSGGGSIVKDGAVLVDGARLGTCVTDENGCYEGWSLAPGHRLDFVANFNGDPFQHAGFGQSIGEGQPWAIFSTSLGNTLQARTMTADGAFHNTDIPGALAFLGAPHRYTIDWRADGVDFYIDGVLKVSDDLDVGGPMRPIAASDYNVFGGVVAVDWMRASPYASSGIFESRIFDADATVNWSSIQWNATTPAGSSVQIKVRTGGSPTIDASWSAWQAIAGPGALNLTSRYIQYQAVLTTADTDVTPSLDNIIISTGHAPVAVPDSIVVPENGVTILPPTGANSLTDNDTDADNDPLEVVAAGPASHGAVTVLFDGSVRYEPQANYSGPDSFVYTVSDGLLTSSALVTIDVRFGNVPPVAVNDFYSVNEDTLLSVPINLGLLKNDTDTEHDVLTAELLTLPAHGVLSANSFGGFTYMPNPNYAGPDTFTYRARDGVDYSQPATVQITVQQINDAPITEPDAYTAVLDQTLTIAPIKGVLANDHDVEVEDTNPLHAVIVSQPANGTLNFNADGSFTYAPNADFLGTDQFTYAAADHFNAVGNTGIVTITVAIKAVDQAVNSGGTVNTGSEVSPTDPLISAVTSPTAATIRIAQGVISASPAPSGYTFVNQQVNIQILNQDGTELAASASNPIRLAFTIDGSLLLPGETENSIQMFRNGVNIPNCLGQTTIPAGNLDPCITAREGGPALNNDVRLTVLSTHASKWNMGLSSGALGNAPHAQNDGVYFVDFQTPLVVAASGILGNDYGRDGLTAVLTAGSEVNGTVDLSPSGGFTFTPGASACGNASFRYRATDGTTESNEATVSIVIDCLPHANADTASVSEDSGANIITVLVNDTDPDPGQTLTVTAVGAASHGVAAIAMGGQAISYTPAADYFGPDSFDYTISDGRGGTSTSTVTVTVTAVNDVPSFLKGANQSLNEDAGAQSLAGWASAISAGPANEAAQTLTFLVSNSNASLFAVQPAIAADGTLSYTPAADANGSATVTVRLQDSGGTLDGGVDTTAPQTFSITVASVNDAPSFANGGDKTVAEDAGPQSFAAWATAISAGPGDEASQTLTFQVTGNSNPALFSAAPSVAANGTLTFTPAANVTGSATITVNLRDDGGMANGGVDTSAAQSFVINVTAVNDAPSFTKGADQSVLEDAAAQTVASWATAISAGPDESGQALTFVVSNSNAALFSSQPAIAADGTLTYTPAPNANGSATVTVRLQDDGGTADGGADISLAQTFSITVASVNDAPSFAKGGDQTVAEDAGAQSFAAWATSISKGPADEASQALTFEVTGNSNPALFSAAPSVAADGTLTFTPAANATGTATISLRLRDSGGTANSGIDASASQSFVINVTAVNDAPSFTKGADQSVLEDAGAKTVASWATAISAGPNESGQVLTFLVSNDNAALFSVQPAIAANGTLSFTPAANAFGSATVTVRLQDDGGTANGGADISLAQTFSITVASVNDAPSFANGGDKTVAEDAGAQSFAAWATAISAGPANEASQTLTFQVTGNSNPALFSAAPSVAANGTLTFTPAANVSGSATIIVNLRDSGGTANGGVDTAAAQSFVINVTAINDAPSFTKGADQTVLEDAAAQSVANWASAISAGPNESGQAVDFLVSNDNAALFSAQPAIAANGTLTYTAAANAFGSATVTVRLHDNGGIANGGVDTSAAQTFTISITGINDAPSFVKGANVSVNEDAGAQSQAAWATSVTAGPNESGQSVSFVVSNSNNALFSAQPAIAANGTLTFTAAANVSGTATVTVRVTDNGGTANGGVDSSANETFTITVLSVNDAPSFVKGADQTVLVDSGARTVAGWATSMSAGPSDESSQALDFLVSNSNNALFSAQPAISGGTLTFTPAAGATGSAIVTVRLHDNGGTANGGVDTSAPETFTITVMPKPSLAIDSVTVEEGTGVNVPAVFTVSLSAASPATTTVNYATANGTATTPKDYLAASGSLSFAPGEVSKTITVSVVGDTTKEKTEVFAVNLSTPINATIADGNGLGTIIDDDSTPHLQATSTRQVEGTGTQSTQMMTFAVAPTNANSEPMTVEYTTLAGEATKEVDDFTPTTGTIVFPPESTDPIFIKVPIVGDRRHEKNQKVILHLMNAFEAIIDRDGQGDIEDDDPQPTISIDDVTVGEAVSGTVNAVLTVRLSNDSAEPITVRYATDDGTAIGGADYVSGSNMLTFQPGETSHVINITVNAGAYSEAIETFLVRLNEATNATIAKGTAMVSINPPSAWVTSSTSEWQLGSVNAGADVTETANGEIVLKAASGSEFYGSALPTGWTNPAIFGVTGGTTSVANGQVTLEAMTVLGPTAYTVGRTLEFAATFTGTANQNVGFGVTGANLPPYVMFGVKADGVLYARTIGPAGVGITETPIPGSWFDAPHQFRIDWVAGANAFWIDGVKVATHAVSLPKNAQLRPAATDVALGDGTLKVDWMRVTPYATSGIYTSSIYDAGSSVLWQNLSFLADMPTGSSVAVRVRTAESLDAAGAPVWSAWKPLASGALIGQSGRYAQYELTLQTTAVSSTPTVKEVALSFLK